MINVLGLHFGHDASAALVVDGKVVAAVSEERFTRVKMYRGFPSHAIQAVLQIGDVKPRDVHAVAVASKDLSAMLTPNEITHRLQHGISRRLTRQRIVAERCIAYASRIILGMGGHRSSEDGERDWQNHAHESSSDVVKSTRRIMDHLVRMGFARENIAFYDHHDCHAAVAFYSSPFADARVFTLDGCGDGASGTVSVGEGSRLHPRYSKNDALDSVGLFYSAITQFLGFTPNRHEGKITGLAAHGDPAGLYNAFRTLFRVDPQTKTLHLEIPNTQTPFDLQTMVQQLKHWGVGLRTQINLAAQPNLSAAWYGWKFYALLHYIQQQAQGRRAADVAAAAQGVTEDIVCDWISGHLEMRGPSMENVALAGGVFANVRVNQRVRALPGVRNVFVHAAMGDDGLALGSAYLAHRAVCLQRGQQPVVQHSARSVDSVYLGTMYSDHDILRACAKAHVKCEHSADVPRRVAQLLHAGYVVGRFHGRMEWGPRALGHRSILIRPTDASVNDTVNQRLRRTEFMPFAPSILAEVAGDYLMDWQPEHSASELMTMTYVIFPDKRTEISAVVHVDGTARPQVVFQHANPDLHAILSAYKTLSGIGVVINTSFNMHEEPIVESPQDAIRALLNGCVDVLVAENYVISRVAMPAISS